MTNQSNQLTKALLVLLCAFTTIQPAHSQKTALKPQTTCYECAQTQPLRIDRRPYGRIGWRRRYDRFTK